MFVSSIYLLKNELESQTLTAQYEYLGTQTAHFIRGATHFDTASAPRARQLSIRRVPLSGRNVIPHLYSYSGLIFIFTAPFILIVIPKAELILN